MAINSPRNPRVARGTRQTEEKARGLYKGVGNYRGKGARGKTLNLTDKQLGAAGRKAASARSVSISDTRYDSSSKLVLGPKGKPLTGQVDLGGGNIAVYLNGKRIRASAGLSEARRKAASSGSSKSGNGSGGGSDSKTKKPNYGSERYYRQSSVPLTTRQNRGDRKATSATVTGAMKMWEYDEKTKTYKPATRGTKWN